MILRKYNYISKGEIIVYAANILFLRMPLSKLAAVLQNSGYIITAWHQVLHNQVRCLLQFPHRLLDWLKVHTSAAYPDMYISNAEIIMHMKSFQSGPKRPDESRNVPPINVGMSHIN